MTAPLPRRGARCALSLIFVSLALSAACVESDNNFDFEGEEFYYGCNNTTDCTDPRGESIEYVCCYDRLDPSEEGAVCEGRCLKLGACPEEARSTTTPNVCDYIDEGE